MSELQSLGAHVDEQLNAHLTAHAERIATEEQKRANGKMERVEKARALHLKLERALKAEGTWNSQERFANKWLTQLENGTRVSGQLMFNTNMYNNQGVGHITGGRYVESGEIQSQVFAGKKLNHEEVSKILGLELHIGLHTKDETYGIKSQDSVYVGKVIDPESIVVPEQALEDGTSQYSVIGSDDPRFSPIMQSIDHLTNPSSPKIQWAQDGYR